MIVRVSINADDSASRSVAVWASVVHGLNPARLPGAQGCAQRLVLRRESPGFGKSVINHLAWSIHYLEFPLFENDQF